MTKLFISHAAHDAPLVEAVVDLLESGVGVPHRDIFCSSLKGQSIKPGDGFVSSIRTSLDEATCVLALISEAYYASAFCMCELGGVWLQSKSFLPVLVPPVDYSNLKAVLGGLQVSKIGSEADLDELRDELVGRLGIAAHSTPRWNSKRKWFLDELPVRIEKVKFTGPVERGVYVKLEKEYASYKAEYEAREKEILGLKKMVDDLKKVKDSAGVSKVVRKYSSSIDVFEELVRAAAKALDGLPRPVCEALYYRTRNEDYSPKGEDAWSEVQGPIEYGDLELNSDEDGVRISDGSPRAQKAASAIGELERWLESPPEDFYEWYQKEAGGEQPKITLRTFWNRHLK